MADELARLTGALLDRLTDHVHILEMNGDSYRLKSSRKKKDPGGRIGRFRSADDMVAASTPP